MPAAKFAPNFGIEGKLIPLPLPIGRLSLCSTAPTAVS
jgi:hypothetical protein